MGYKACKGCVRRRVACHSYCEIYLEFKKKREKIYESRKINAIADIGPEAYIKSRDRRCERK